MEPIEILIIIVFEIWILFITAFFWFKVRPNYEKYRENIFFRYSFLLMKINTEKKWRTVMAITTIAGILAALLVIIIAIAEGFRT